MTRPEITFGPYRLDLKAPRLSKGDEPVALQPRPLAVLCYLAARPGEVVARDELIRTLWAGTYVTRTVLKVAVHALREALGDDAEAPRYIETVGRKGYRFIAAEPPAVPREPGPALVGRAHEIALLRTPFDDAAGGARRLVFVTGEAGIGKTTLVEHFLASLDEHADTWIARGRCLEQYGRGEAYLPLLEAIGRLARDEVTGEVGRILRRHAPTWASQLPALGADPTAPPATPARMLRELADALEVLTHDRTLVLVLEDLQWSDPSTVDLIAYVARRHEPARLLLLGTLRPADVVGDHPLRLAKHELQAVTELALAPLSLADVQAYVDARFPGAPREQMRRLAARVHRRTDGNALFVVDMVHDLVAQETLVWRDGRWRVQQSIAQATGRTPPGLRELVEHRLQRLAPAMRAALEAASVAGDEFAVATVAAALDEPPARVEDLFEKLAAQGLLIGDAGIAEAADGTLAGRYRFLHTLYRHVLYEGIGAARRMRLHRAIGLQEESAGRVAELAMHFERGGDHARALAYHQLAGAAALERHAAHEAAGHFDAALEALAHLPALSDRAERELDLVLSRATVSMTTCGYAAPETERDFTRARALCDALPGSPKVLPVLRGLLSYRQVRAELDAAHELGELLLRRADADALLRVQAHYGHGATLFHMGRLEPARMHVEKALVEYDPATHADHMRVYGGYDPGVACSMWLAWTLALMGRFDDAASRGREGLELAGGLAQPFSLAWAHYATGALDLIFGDYLGAASASAEAERLAEEHGFPYVLGMATANRGWAMIMQGNLAGGIPVLRDGVAAVDATGAALVRPQYLGMLGAADAIQGDFDAAVARVEDALAEVERTGQRLHEVQLLVAKSRLLAATEEQAEACLRQALDVARQQGARTLELRVAIDLARRWRDGGRAAEARAVLAEAHAFFATSARAIRDVVAARRLLAELGGA